MTGEAGQVLPQRLVGYLRTVARLAQRIREWPPVTYKELRATGTIQQLQELADVRTIDGFNGQLVRAKYLQWLFERLGCTSFLETGTYLGATSLLASEILHTRVLTVELGRAYWLARLRAALCAVRSVRFERGDSRTALARWMRVGAIGARPMVYLDAHWYADHPLRDELSIVLARGSAVVVIDDFRVPGDDGYGYDQDSTFTLDLNAIEDFLPAERTSILFPSVPSDMETGLRRGTCVVLVDLNLPESTDFAATLFTRAR